MTLIKKVESTQIKQKIAEQLNKEYTEDATQDRASLIQCKNLPSIRDKLFSIKTKQ